MFIELVDALRCPVPHEESWLVASTTRMEARHIVEGTLGCPVCRAEYPVHRGAVDFRREPTRPRPHATEGRDATQAMRLAAFLALSDALGFAVLLDAWGVQAQPLRELVETPLIVVDPPADVIGEPGVSVLLTDGPLPLAMSSARGVAVHRDSAARLAEAVRVTRTGGRLVSPAGLTVPAGVRELARDESLWVAEKEAERSPLVTLHVRRG